MHFIAKKAVSGHSTSSNNSTLSEENKKDQMQGGKSKSYSLDVLKPSLAKFSDHFSKEKNTAIKHLLCFCACFHSFEKNETV